MTLVAYTGSERPPVDKTPAIKPRLVSWTSRIWRESTERSFPLFKVEARLELRDVEDRVLQEALRPYAAQLQKMVIVPLAAETGRLAPWAVGRFDIDSKSAYMFFHDFLGAPNGMLMLNVMQDGGLIERHRYFAGADDRRAASPSPCPPTTSASTPASLSTVIPEAGASATVIRDPAENSSKTQGN